MNILSQLAKFKHATRRERHTWSASAPIRRTLRPQDQQRGSPMSIRRIAHWTGLSLGAALALLAAASHAQQQPAAAAAAATPPPALPPLFLREEWRQRARPADAGPDFIPEGGVTAAAVTNASLELNLYDPDAANIPRYLANPPPRTVARDWGGPSCIQLAGFNQNPPPERVANGTRTDPPNLWTGVCQTAVAATLRHKTSYVDLTGLARIRWVTRVSGFHVVRPVVKLADGNWFVGDYGEGASSANSTLFLESEFAVSSVRWLPLDISRVVTV